MAKYQEEPIDRANACVTYLSAIDSLLCAANQEDLQPVKASDLAMLLSHIRRELDEALDDLNNKQYRPLKIV